MAEPVVIRGGSFRAEIAPEQLKALRIPQIKGLFKILAANPDYLENEDAQAQISDTLQAQENEAKIQLDEELYWDEHYIHWPLRSRRAPSSRVKHAKTAYNRAQKLNKYFHKIVD